MTDGIARPDGVNAVARSNSPTGGVTAAACRPRTAAAKEIEQIVSKFDERNKAIAKELLLHPDQHLSVTDLVEYLLASALGSDACKYWRDQKDNHKEDLQQSLCKTRKRLQKKGYYLR